MDANELVSAIKALINNLENAQEDRDEWKKLYRASENYGEKQQARAEAAEAECERLRAENESLREQLDEALAQIKSMWKTIAP